MMKSCCAVDKRQSQRATESIPSPSSPLPSAPSPFGSGEHEFLSRNYNESFQRSLLRIRSLTPNTRREDRIAAYASVAHLAEDFQYTVQTYGRIIISEVYLPPEEKTVKTTKVGGIAGGDKYLVGNVLFKFAVDSSNIFGGDDAMAIKVAGHELKGVSAAFNAWLPDFSVPLLSLVDYRGFRLIGMTLLPISRDTLVYGSCDAGRTIVQKASPEIVEALERLAKRLNLRDHPLGGDGRYRMPVPVDLEVHHSEADGRTYLLDFSRMLPPQAPHRGSPGISYLYRLLRLELVQKYPVPLCADGFSPFLRLNPKGEESEELKAEVKAIHTDLRDATLHLTQQVIPEFARILQALSDPLRREVNLIHELHYHGINVRYLYAVLKHLTPEEKYWRARILVEMISRVIKDLANILLRSSMRQFCYAGEGIYRREVVRFLNQVVDSGKKGEKWWSELLLPALMTKFNIPPEDFENINFRELVFEVTHEAKLGEPRCLILLRLTELLGLRYSQGLYQELKEGTSDLFQFRNPIDETDVTKMKERIHQLNIISHSKGFLLRMKGIWSKDPLERERLLTLAADCFHEAISVYPHSTVSLRNYGDVLALIRRHGLAEHVYRRCIEINPRDTNTHFKFACFLDLQGRYLEAEEHFLQSLEANPRHSNVACVYADFLMLIRGDLAAAERFYQLAIDSDESNKAALNNMGILQVFSGVQPQAEKLLRRACTNERGLDTPRRFLNLATFYSDTLQNADLGLSVYEEYESMHKSSLKMSSGEHRAFDPNEFLTLSSDDDEDFMAGAYCYGGPVPTRDEDAFYENDDSPADFGDYL